MWDLGQIPRDPSYAKWFWSSRTCLYRHLYPVGFLATKEEFGRKFTMTITSEGGRPLFTVKDEATGTLFSGLSHFVFG